MRNLKFFLITAYLLVPSVRAAPVILVEFDTPHMFAEITDGKVNGYYGVSLPQFGERPSLSCEFFITSDSAKSNRRGLVQMHSFYTEGTYDKRDDADVFAGELFVQNDGWTLQMEQVPEGCSSAAGGGFLKGSAVPNIVTKRTLIIGILVVNKRASFFNLKGNVFVKRKGFLVPGNAVVAYSQRNNFYFVRYLNAETSMVAEGWVPTESVSDPFPR